MADLAPVPPEHRKQTTLWLIAGGVASLLLPLLAAIYIRMNESSPVPGPSGRSDLFEHRELGEVKLTPALTAVIPRTPLPSPSPFGEGLPAAAPAAPAGSSLDFIKPNDEMRARASAPAKTASAPAAQAPAAAPEAPAAAKTEPKTATKNAKKGFAMPKLQPTKWSNAFSKSGKDAKKGAHGQQTDEAPEPQAPGAGGGPDMSEMLKKLPPGAENDPRIQQLLKNQK